MQETRRGRRAVRPSFRNRVNERLLAWRPAALLLATVTALSLIFGGGYAAVNQLQPAPAATLALAERPAESVSRNIDRPLLEGAKRVNIDLVVDGKTTRYEVPAVSLGEALGEAGIVVGPFDTIDVPLSTKAREGLVVTIERRDSGTLTEEEITEFETVEKPDPTMLVGEEEVENEGQEGIRRTTYTVFTSGGQETERVEMASVVVQEAEDRVVRVGTREPAPGMAPILAGLGSEDLPPISPGSAQAIARDMLAEFGWQESQFTCLHTLWHRESGWNYRATNPSSGAYGIPQALPGGKMASAGADWRTNPATQIRWGLGYIQGRYGSPCGALNHSYAHNWY